MAEADTSIPPYSWRDTVQLGLKSYGLVSVAALARRVAQLKLYLSPPEKPSERVADLVKTYPCRPWMAIRIFYPPSFDKTAAAPAKTLPVLFAIHGGGFVLGNAEDMDAWCHDFVRENGPTLVVALAYRKAPMHPFPTAVHDVEALIHAVLDDAALPVDHSRVAVCGWSAGGNLALSVASLPSLQGRVHTVVPIYPVTDFSVPGPEKVLRRHYKPTLAGVRGQDVDLLQAIMPVFNWSYLPSGATPADLAAPLLSPRFLPRESLPPYVFIVAAELDLLSYEAWQTACALAGRPLPTASHVGASEVHPPNQLILDDERFAFETRTATSSYRWLLVPDALHGFDMSLAQQLRGNQPPDDGAVKRAACMHLINDWLFSGPFKA